MDGKWLKELRRRKGFTLDTLSERTGISKSYLSLIERDIQTNPSLDILHRLAKTFEVDVEDLVRFDKDEGTVVISKSPIQIKGTFKFEIELSAEDMSPRKLEQIKGLIQTLKEEKAD
ncbi:DNA-binding transcriptional regulator, XRE-family HTH domain [Mesobacillus persicus]|uniref:DNA-binding transcriptional regulator, XRE-family HTH domain n=1 Tax=Mesobacillus persicus TaxID=930146 RepID=A0A1H8CH74_9BACI|nr:helix-turn-helix transcriptional regulator [Mesobacillus persicus]SEM94360.1 DNA-binding transcriptional regulator, XRE-family HTH domain [Mesobacillus persicus]